MLLKPFTILASSIVFASLFESVSPLPINENAPVYDPYYNSFDTPIYKKFTASKGVHALTPNALVPNHPILPPQSSIDPNWMPDDTSKLVHHTCLMFVDHKNQTEITSCSSTWVSSAPAFAKSNGASQTPIALLYSMYYRLYQDGVLHANKLGDMEIWQNTVRALNDKILDACREVGRPSKWDLWI
ncbi:hypothetical protein FB446DRAFT_732714 [Lentinula raphanica]|nr:hypothetical protein FB446DRAFT_732714 [Lentinula raphanica]